MYTNYILSSFINRNYSAFSAPLGNTLSDAIWGNLHIHVCLKCSESPNSCSTTLHQNIQIDTIKKEDGKSFMIFICQTRKTENWLVPSDSTVKVRPRDWLPTFIQSFNGDRNDFMWYIFCITFLFLFWLCGILWYISKAKRGT